MPAVILCLALVAGDEPAVAELLEKARLALKQGKADAALRLANQAVEREPKDPLLRLFRGSIHEALRQHEQAIADYSQAIQLDPKRAEAYDRRGSELFKLGRVAESLADFDKFLELRPDAGPGHWRRGISCYYAGQFEAGKKQFQSYEQVDTNDVENAVWHFLCNARKVGIDKARAELLKIGKDGRVPMMEVYGLFAGKLKPADVLAAATAGNPPAETAKVRLFYAHLYLGIWFDISGDPKQALQHLELAADQYRIGHYMGDVAVVHRNLLQKKK